MKYLYAKGIEAEEKFSMAESEYRRMLKLLETKSIEPESADAIKKVYETRKNNLINFRTDKPISVIMLTLNKAEGYLQFNEENNALPIIQTVLSQLGNLDKNTLNINLQKDYDNFQTKAYLCYADILMRKCGIGADGKLTFNKENAKLFKASIDQIQKNLDQAKNLDDQSNRQLKTYLLDKFKNSKSKFESIKFSD